MPDAPPRATLSVAIITFNEEENIGRTLASVKDIADEIIVVDSGSTDRTVEIAKQFGAKVFVEEWKGFAAQKNSALDKCTCDWILSLDADEEVPKDTRDWIEKVLAPPDAKVRAWSFSRRNMFLGKWIRRGGFYPDSKDRLFKRGEAHFEDRRVHEDIVFRDDFDCCEQRDSLGDLIHHQYPTLTAYIEHMNRYSSLGAEMVVENKKRVGFSFINIIVRPIATFLYNYFFRLGFLDGKEGLLLHLYHSVYVSWKYAKAWELSRKNTKR
jgi:glycosyltransferase involved in cell wall biosynthesis